MSGEIRGIENNVEVRVIYLDNKEEVKFRSIAACCRFLGTTHKTLITSLNPLTKRRYTHNNRELVVRLKK